MLGAVGDDDFGRFLRAALLAGGVEDALVRTVPGGSGMSVAISDASGDYAATIVSGANLAIDPADLDRLEWRPVAVLVLQSEIPEAVNIAAACHARAHGIPVVLNAAPARALSAEFSALIDILVVNAVEAEMFGTPPVTDLASAGIAARALGQKHPGVVVTAGGAGLAWVQGADAGVVAAEKIKVVSTHGAGDCFTGSLAAALARGGRLAEACDQASHAAALHVAGKGSDRP